MGTGETVRISVVRVAVMVMVIETPLQQNRVPKD